MTHRHLRVADRDFHRQSVELQPRKAPRPCAASSSSARIDRARTPCRRVPATPSRQLLIHRGHRQASFAPAWPCCTSDRRSAGKGPGRTHSRRAGKKSNPPRGKRSRTSPKGQYGLCPIGSNGESGVAIMSRRHGAAVRQRPHPRIHRGNGRDTHVAPYAVGLGISYERTSRSTSPTSTPRFCAASTSSL